jgi:hypothetical protein
MDTSSRREWLPNWAANRHRDSSSTSCSREASRIFGCDFWEHMKDDDGEEVVLSGERLDAKDLKSMGL